MVGLFKVLNVGELSPVQQRVNGELVDMEKLSNGEEAVKRTLTLRSTYDYSVDQSGKVNYYQDTHYVELLGNRAKECALVNGCLILADLRGRESKISRESLGIGKFIPIMEEDL